VKLAKRLANEGRRLAFCNEAGGYVMAFSDNSSISATAARWRRRCRLPTSPVNGSRRVPSVRKNSPCSIASAISLRHHPQADQSG
jgi:hypothetical protein